MKTEIFPSYSAFLSREDKTVNGVSQAFADANEAAMADILRCAELEKKGGE